MHRSFFNQLVALAGLALVGPIVAPTVARAQGDRTVTPAPTAETLERPLVPLDAINQSDRLADRNFVLSIDDSTSQERSDPRGQRHRAGVSMARYLAEAGGPGRTVRLGVLRFGSEAEVAAPMSELPGALASVRAALERPSKPLGGTDGVAAVRAALKLAGRSTPTSILMVTDGGLHRRGGGGYDALRALLASAAGVTLHVIITDARGRFGVADSARWVDAGASTVNRLPGASGPALERLLTDLVAQDLGLGRARRQALTADAPASIEVAPYTEGVVVTAVGADSRSEVEVTDPSGRVRARLSGRFGLARIARPAPGAWEARLVGGRSTAVGLDVEPLRAVLIAPAPTAPAGRPLVPAVELRGVDGRPIELLRDAPLFVEAEVSPPHGRPRTVALRHVGGARFQAGRGVESTRPGRYTVGLLVRGDTRLTLRTTERKIDVVAQPYLDFVDLEVRVGRPLRVELELRRSGRPVAPSGALLADPATIAVARVLSREADPVPVVWDGGSRFSATFATELEDGERARVRVELGARAPSGMALEDRVEADVTAHLRLVDRIAGVLVVAMRVAGVLGTLAVLAAIGWFVTRPRMYGAVTVDGQQRSVQNRRIVTIPGDPPKTVFSQGGREVFVRGRIPRPWGTRTAERPPSQIHPRKFNRR